MHFAEHVKHPLIWIFFAEYLLECSTSMLEEDSNTRCTFEKSEEDKNLPFRIRTKKKHRVTGGHFSAGSKKEYLREPYSGWAFLGLLTDDGEGGACKKAPPLPKICHTYPTMMKLGTVIPYLKKIPKICESRDTPLSSADISIFSPEISKFCYIKKYRYSLHFDT